MTELAARKNLITLTANDSVQEYITTDQGRQGNPLVRGIHSLSVLTEKVSLPFCAGT